MDDFHQFRFILVGFFVLCFIIFLFIDKTNNIEDSISSPCLKSLDEYTSNSQNIENLLKIADNMERSNFEGLISYHYRDQKIVIEKYSGSSFDSLPVIHELTKKTIFEIKRESGSILFAGCKSDWKYDVGVLYYTKSNPFVRSFQTIKKLKNQDVNGKWAIVARKPAY